MLLAFIVIAAAAAAAGYWLAARRRNAPKPEPRDKKPAGRFGAVAIRVRKGACDAARALEGQRFLAKDAPPLPLPQCTSAQCSCGFAKLSDRRTEGRRFELGGLSAAQFLTTNRRQKRDRRHAEKAKKR
jgi:hypothetical protein